MSTQTTHQRLSSLDQFRGVTIIAMVLVNFLADVRIVPTWLKHAPDIGLTVAGLVAPFFIFAIGLTYRRSFLNRAQRDGQMRATLHFIRRYLVLIGIGTILSAFETQFGFDTKLYRWGVLEAIGFAGLLSLLVVRLPGWTIFTSGVVLLSIYAGLLDRFWLATVLNSSHGGILGSFSWSALLILSIGLNQLFDNPRTRTFLYPLSGLLSLIAGFGISFWIPISKNRVSPSYILISLGAAVIVFYIFYLLADKFSIRLHFFEIWGQNPLAFYLLHMLLLGFLSLPPVPAWNTDAAPLLVVIQAIVLLAVLTIAGVQLKKRNLILKL
jgi:predicted acyltransferase